ncbi:MAG: arylsulfatase, partial [Candidatus Cryptobacteroides sp.]
RTRHFYNQARSAPTRASMITGRYPHQVGYGALMKVEGYPAYAAAVNKENIFIPEVLESAGYFSLMTGKWHLSRGNGTTPTARGFDRSLDCGPGELYFWNDPNTKGNKSLFWNDNKISFTDSRLPEGWYSSDLWATIGLRFVDQALNAGKPFFWYLAFNGAHFPLQAPAETIAKYRGRYKEGWEKTRDARFRRQIELGLFNQETELTPLNPKSPSWDSLTEEQKDRYDLQMAIYAAVIEEMDNSIGKVLEHLEKKGELENTLIILLSDNGGNGEPGMEGRCIGDNPGDANSTVYLGASWADAANTPFFLYKHHAHEGGCNTPLIISWPAAIRESLRGSLRKDVYGHVTDIMPTVLEAARTDYPSTYDGRAIPPMEGISLMPLLSGGKIDGDRPIIVEHEGNKMLRKGKWKIVQEYKEEEWCLYDIVSDPTEMHDRSEDYPEILNSMIQEYLSLSERTDVDNSIDVFKIGAWYTPVDEY